MSKNSPFSDKNATDLMQQKSIRLSKILLLLSQPNPYKSPISSKVYEKPYSNVVVLRTETVNMKLAVMATMMILTMNAN